MTDLMRDDEGQIRVLGSKVFIGAAIERLRATVDVSYDGNLRANRYGDGHRAHAHIRLTEPATPRPDGQQSPRRAAEDAKVRRDLGAEIAVLTDADSDLRARPWFPIQVGDVVCWSVDLPDGRYGETLIAVDEPNWSTEAGAPLRKVSATRLDQDSRWEYEDFYDIWFEAGPSKIAIIRHGHLVHGTVHAVNGGAR